MSGTIHRIAKKALSVNVFNSKVLIGDTIFTSPNGDGTSILLGHSSRESSSRLRGKYLRFLIIFKTVNICPAPEIELPHPALHSSALTTGAILPRKTHQAGDFKLGIIYCI